MQRRISPALVAAALIALPAILQAQTFKVSKVNIGGDGSMDYVYAKDGKVYIPRGTHTMIVEGATGKVLADIPDTPGAHGTAISKEGIAFITSARDSSVTMVDTKTMTVKGKVNTHSGGLDGIMWDDFNDRIILTNHSRPVGTLMSLDGATGEVKGTVELADNGPEGAASDGKGMLYVNLEGKNAIQVIDAKAMKAVALWPIEQCDGPTGIAMDRTTNRIFAGCSNKSVVVDAKTGKVVAELTNGNGVDALGWDPVQKLIYIPASQGNVTIYHEDSPDKYTLVSTMDTFKGARTIGVDVSTHTAYTFTPEYGPAPTPAAGTTPPAGGRGAPRGPMVGAWLITISH